MPVGTRRLQRLWAFEDGWCRIGENPLAFFSDRLESGAIAV